MLHTDAAGVVPEPVSAFHLVSDFLTKKSDGAQRKDTDLTEQVKSVALNFLKVMYALFNSHKGIDAIAKLGRNVESLMIEWNKYVQETELGAANSGSTTVQEGNPSFNTGFRESLKTLSIANGILAGVSSFVSIPERIEHGKRIIQVAKEIWKGDWAGVTLMFVLDELAFWLKQLANDVELIRFLESHRFYNLGAASNGLTIAKSFFDGIGSVFGIWLSALKIHHALKGSSDAKASAAKWEERAKKISVWDPTSLHNHAAKMELKTHVYFLEEAAKMAKDEKLSSRVTEEIDSQKEAVRQALFARKVDKILQADWLTLVERQLRLAKLKAGERSFVLDLLQRGEYAMKAGFDSAKCDAIEAAMRHAGGDLFGSEGRIQAVIGILRSPEVYQFYSRALQVFDSDLTSAQRHALESAFAHIRTKLWTAKLSPASRQVVLDILDDKQLSLPRKHAALLDIRDSKVEGNYFGLVPKNLNQNTEEILRNASERSKHKYNNLFSDANRAAEQWRNLKACPQQIRDAGAVGNEAREHLTTYATLKYETFKEEKGDQKKIITRSVVSIAFSVGIIALVTLSLALAFAKPGSLPGFILKWRPFIFAGLGITVSTIGLVKFGLDELFKIKPREKPLLNNRFAPIAGPDAETITRNLGNRLPSWKRLP